MRFIGVILLAAHLFMATAYGDEELKDLLEPSSTTTKGPSRFPFGTWNRTRRMNLMGTFRYPLPA